MYLKSSSIGRWHVFYAHLSNIFALFNLIKCQDNFTQIMGRNSRVFGGLISTTCIKWMLRKKCRIKQCTHYETISVLEKKFRYYSAVFYVPITWRQLHSKYSMLYCTLNLMLFSFSAVRFFTYQSCMFTFSMRIIVPSVYMCEVCHWGIVSEAVFK